MIIFFIQLACDIPDSCNRTKRKHEIYPVNFGFDLNLNKFLKIQKFYLNKPLNSYMLKGHVFIFY